MVRTMFQNRLPRSEPTQAKTKYSEIHHVETHCSEENSQHREFFRALTLGALTALSSIGNGETFGQDTHDTITPPSSAVVPKTESHFPFEVTLSGDPSSIPELFTKFNDPTLFTITFGRVIATSDQLLPELILHDGTTLHAPLSIQERMVWGKGSVMTSWEGQEFSTPTMAIKALRPQPDTKYSPAWKLASRREFKEDTLLVRGEGGLLSEVSGQILAVSHNTVELSFNGESINAPLRKIEGLFFASTRGNPPTPGITVLTNSGKFCCTDVGLREEGGGLLTLVTKSGATFCGPLNSFQIQRAAVKTHFFPQISHEVVEWKPWSGGEENSVLTFASVPRTPIEVDAQSSLGGIRLNGAVKVHFRLRGEYERVLFSLPDEPNDTQLLALSTELGELPVTHRPNLDGSSLLEVEVKGIRSLWIELKYNHPIRVEPLLFVPR